MTEHVFEMLEQLVFLGAYFQLTYEKDRDRPWRLDVRCQGMKPLATTATPEDLPWITTFAVNTVIAETRKDEGIPLHELPE